MAGRKLSVSAKTVALAASTAKTCLQTKAVNTPHKLLRLMVGLQGTSPTDPPVLVELVRQTSAGTMSAVTPRLRDNGVTYTPNLVAQSNATAEPTDAGVVVWQTTLHPQESASWLLSDLEDDDEDLVDVGSWLGVRLTPGAITGSNTGTVQLDVEE